jgi:hypothetical protein
VVVMVMAAMVVMVIVIVLFATGLPQRLFEFSIDRGHKFYGSIYMLGKRRPALIVHGHPPFIELIHMSFIMLYPVLQHDPQFFDVVHSISN